MKTCRRSSNRWRKSCSFLSGYIRRWSALGWSCAHANCATHQVVMHDLCLLCFFLHVHLVAGTHGLDWDWRLLCTSMVSNCCRGCLWPHVVRAAFLLGTGKGNQLRKDHVPELCVQLNEGASTVLFILVACLDTLHVHGFYNCVPIIKFPEACFQNGNCICVRFTLYMDKTTVS